jgi:sugar/nucleoside kinase (ribokinase family)
VFNHPVAQPASTSGDYNSPQRPTVLSAGILVADLFAKPIERLPNPGELTATSGLAMTVGGSAANVAVALRILGEEVAVAGKVGSDLQGDLVISELENRGVDVSQIRRTISSATSGTVVINVIGEDRRYLHCVGANAELRFEDLDLSVLGHASVLYFGGYLALPSFDVGSLTVLFREAKLRGLTTVLDVTMPVNESFDIQSVARPLRYTDYFLPNCEEAGRLTGEQDERSQAKRLSESNPECAIIITRGARGPLARQRGRFIDTPPFQVNSVDESGAGDAFAAGLISATVKDWPLEAALIFASAVGASRTLTLGSFNSVFTFAEALSFLEEQDSKSPEWDTFFRAASCPA